MLTLVKFMTSRYISILVYLNPTSHNKHYKICIQIYKSKMALQSLATETCKQRHITLDKYNEIRHVANKVTSRIILIIILTQSSKVPEMPHNYK